MVSLPVNGDVTRIELKDVSEVCKIYDVDIAKGLSEKEAEERRSMYGWNELDKEDPTSLFELILEQFDDILVKILLAAAVISFLLAYFDESSEGDAAYIEPIVILAILIINAFVGVWQESNAEAALEALKDLQPETARCLRDGVTISIPARELVPGDIVEIHSGDRCPADIRVVSIKTSTLQMEQSQLTGESESVEKFFDALPMSAETVIQAKTNIAFAATTVVSGTATGVVIKIGMKTEIGVIQQSVQEAAEEAELTPLKKKLDEFGEALSKIIGIVCLLVWIINYNHFFDPCHGSAFKGTIYYFKIAVALAVAAIPEGLPAVITTCLALGTRKMAKKNAIVRKLPSVETLGCTTVICSDKTGTLTTNEMSCVTICQSGIKPEDLNVIEVTGNTYAPEGVVVGMEDFSKSRVLLAQICSLCNEASIEYTKGKYVRVGEPTEAALKVLVEKMGVPDPVEQQKLQSGRKENPSAHVKFCNDYWKAKFDTVATLEFSRKRKSMSVLCKPVGSSSGNVLFVKGAPESILERCSRIVLDDGSIVNLTETARNVILKKFDGLASDALRCLGFAYKNASGDLQTYDGNRQHPGQQLLRNVDYFHEIESDLVFVGLAGLMDPPRPEVNDMLTTCATAGIRVIMITGDNQRTAERIGIKIGMFDGPEELKNKSFTGTSFFALSEEKQSAYLNSDSCLIFSRAEPKHKQQLVRMLKKKGDVVAMTGDGVNDAPALKQADIGIAMGIAGTEVAKEASDMVLADDNFATIVSAVEEGRSIYNNTQAFIRYLISSNIGEVASIFFTAALGFPENLVSVQLLWVNLVTDGPPATALGFNPPDKLIMKKLPRKSDDVLITNWVFFRYMVIGIYVGFACVAIFAYWYMYYDWSGDGHTLVSFHQLSHWSECPTWPDFQAANFQGMDFSDNPCRYFTDGKVTASTLSLSVLVMIEMLNALNAISEDLSLFTMPPWANPYLLIAIILSTALHFVILYVDVLAQIFKVKPLDFYEWMLVLAFSFPVIIIDEILKVVGREIANRELQSRMKEKME